ncbi:MAG TPA: 50S ribosomal protein L25 [Candidatus Acidoferrales bacterium]|nr:50S ribosomal protein L25 [Candidatus Acidoferrales bacterium]
MIAQPRELVGKRARRLRAQGKVPAVVYGHNSGNQPLTLDRLEFQRVFARAGRTHLVDLEVDGQSAKVLVREIQTHPRRQGPIHVDFYAVSLQEKLRVEIPVQLTGESPIVKLGDADVLHTLHEIEVECLPTDIPEPFVVDISGLEQIDDEVRVRDLKVPPGVTLLVEPDELVVKITHRRELKVEEEAPAVEAEVPAEGEPAAEGAEPAEEQQPEPEKG